MAEEIFHELEGVGLLTRDSHGERVPTRRWRAAVARAALRSIRMNAGDDDPRIDYGWALIELLGDEVPPPRIAEMIDALMSIEHPVETLTAIHPT